MSTIEFLSGDEYQEAVKNIIKDPSPLKLAVSYWGKEILNELGLAERLKNGGNNIRVICDLGHIACRHEPIQELLDRKVSVKRIDRFHAKVWMSDFQVVIGSANASRSALGFLPTNRKYNAEAGIRVTDKTVIAHTRDWFEKLKDHETYSDVSADDISQKVKHHSEEERRKTERSRCPLRKKQTVEFEYFVGREAGQVFRESLNRLGVTQGAGNTHFQTYDRVENMESFAIQLVEGLQILVENATDVNQDNSGPEERIPNSFYLGLDRQRAILHRHIVRFINNSESNYLWLEERDAGNFSLRMAHYLPEMKNIAILTILNDRVTSAGDIPNIYTR